MSVSLITRATPTAERTILHWLDGTDDNDYAAYAAFDALLSDAYRLLREPGMAVPSPAAAGFLALLRVRDSDAEDE